MMSPFFSRGIGSRLSTPFNLVGAVIYNDEGISATRQNDEKRLLVKLRIETTACMLRPCEVEL